MSFTRKRIEMKLWLLFLLYTRTIYSKVIIADNSVSLRNNIVSREDWINLAKYYVSNHKPYNVKKYVPYRPSNKEIIPVIPEFSSSTAIPEVTTPLFGTSTSPFNLDFESTTRSDQATETTSEMSIDSTTETFLTSTQFPETSTMLLSIIGNFPGIETTTRIPYDDALEETTRQDNFNYTTTEIPFINFSTEAEISTTTLMADPETTSEASLPETSTITASETPESTTERIDSTTHQFFNFLDNSSMDEFVISTTTPELETTTIGTESTTILSISTTEIAPFGNETTTIEPAIPESTTDTFNLIKNISNDKFIISTTTPSLDSLGVEDSTTEFPLSTTDVPLSTTMEPVTFESSTEIIDSTEVRDSTTEFPVSTTEVSPSTTMEPVTFESTTEKLDSTTPNNFNSLENSRMEEFVMTSTSHGLETTTEERDSTTEITQSISTTESPPENDTTTEIESIETSTTANDIEKTTEVKTDAELTTTEKISRGTGENANFNGDIIQPKPRKFTYSSDVMPEPYW